MANVSTRLLEKYNVLLEHLDFGYIRASTDGREMEKIVKILRSGQEGFYPQLTDLAVDRLRQLKPDSKLLRTESEPLRKDSLPANEWERISDELASWEKNVTRLHQGLLEVKDEPVSVLPPIRSVTSKVETSKKNSSSEGKATRIKSCDYERWDQYDPDAELLKMELEEERRKEFVAEQNRRNAERSTLIEELPPDEIGQLSDAERTILAGKYREKGNDFFRGKEYQQALQEYDTSLRICATAACYNNRAVTYLKMNKFEEAVNDCDKCLELEPENIKAMLRKAEALRSDSKIRKAFEVYKKLLQLEPNHKMALSAVESLRKTDPDLPPLNSFRMTIEEVTNEQIKTEQLAIRKIEEEQEIDVDFAALIKPKRIVKDKLPDAMKALKSETAKIVKESINQRQERTNRKIDLTVTKPEPRKVLIQEL
ncbi:sperm-associated antigen 1 [Uranotaenia lowii]|uniref:sperm-associated antigen 1 n=1 Tax=Uranotaenia lowii TaxID=190385 RepID=UPI00247A0836|nr:sperm-associated antigen 1 [Uranotaenia lowii]